MKLMSPIQTDLHAAKQDWPLESKDHLCGGHEGAGYVVAIGEHSNTSLKIGDAVGIKWYVFQYRFPNDVR
jgi:propanol-preferring alcohol dehydrogenase